MSNAMIPDFLNVEEFNRFVAEQKDEDIQAWKTADWNNMYEKLDKIIDTDSRFQFARNEGKDALIKLNRNYRLETQDMERLRELSKQLAKNIVSTYGDMASNLTTMMNVDNENLSLLRQYIAQAIDKTIYDMTNYKDLHYDTITGKKLSEYNFNIDDYQVTKSDIKVEDREEGKEGSRGYKDGFSSTIKLTNSSSYDKAMTTAIHESIHAHLQTLTSAQVAAFKALATNPIDGMSEGFYRLLQHNDEYYVSNTENSNGFQRFEELYKNGEISDKEYRQQMHRIFKGYAKQPLETHAEVMALMTEHYFRQETQQYSERAAREFVRFFGKPTEVEHISTETDTLIYKNNPNIAKTFAVLKQFIKPEERASIIDIHRDNRSFFEIPKRYSMQHALNCAHYNLNSVYLLGSMTQVSPPVVTFDDNNNCVLSYTRKDAQKIKDTLQKYAENNAINELKIDTEKGCVYLPQNTKELDKILVKLCGVRKNIENNNSQAQDAAPVEEKQPESDTMQQQFARVRNKIRQKTEHIVPTQAEHQTRAYSTNGSPTSIQLSTLIKEYE